MNIVEKIFKHIKLVSKHKWVVFKLACKVGIPWRGFMHDWSKFSPDWALPQKAIIMPYKYAVEMVCDKMAAGIVYNGKDWKQDTQIKYYMKERETSIVHPQIDKFLLEIFTQVSEQGIDKTLTKKNIREVYDKYCVRMEKLDENKV